MRIFWHLCFVFNWREFLWKEILGLSHAQGKPPHKGESRAVRREGRAQVRELQMTAELTHRQLLSTPCTTASCLCPSRSPPTPSESWKSLEDFLTTASLFTGEALGPPELQQSSSCPFPCSSAQPQSSSISQTWGEQGRQGIHGFGEKHVLDFFFAKLGMISAVTATFHWCIVTYLNKLFKHKDSKM